MKYVIIGKNMEVTPNLDEAVRDKLGKLDKFFAPDTTAHVTLSVDKDRHKIEVTIPVKGSIIRSEQVSNDMYVSIDLVEEVIERQIKKYKGKLIRRHQGGSSFKKEFLDRPEPLGHNFFVFMNAETEQVSVVYKRKGNTYGLLEPDL